MHLLERTGPVAFGICSGVNETPGLLETVSVNDNDDLGRIVLVQKSVHLTGGKGSLTQQVHCGYIVGSGAIRPHYTQWVHGGYFMKEPINLI